VNGSALSQTTVPGARFTVTFNDRPAWPTEGTSMLMHRQTPHELEGSASASKKGKKREEKRKGEKMGYV
jgi:hypothetical protein